MYTFEAPLNTTATNTKASQYSNIFNIINPIDIVPKLAPAYWGFSRYGTDCFLPSKETAGNYFSFYDNMKKAYSFISMGDSYETNFDFYELSFVRNGSDSVFYGKPYTIVSPNYSIGQGAFLDGLIKRLSDKIIETRRNYVNKYQQVIMKILPALLCGKGVTLGGMLDSTVQYLAENAFEMASNPFSLLRHIKGEWATYFSDNLTVDNPNFEAGVTYDEIYNILGEIDDLLIGVFRYPDYAYTAFKFFSKSHYNRHNNKNEILAMLPHYSQVTTAWMESITPDALRFDKSTYRIVKYDCPIDISVYDENNNLCAQIIGDEPQYIEESTIAAYIDENGSKCFILPDDTEYSFVITGTDDGTMNCTVIDYDFALAENVNVSEYYDILVSEGEQFSALLEELPDNESQSVFVITDDEQEVIEPDDIYTDSEIPEYYVTVNTDQDRSDVLGGGTYMRGEFAQVQAFPDSCSTFVGWFEGDECVSEDLDYRFSVKNDIELTAVFADSHEYAETEREEPTCTEKGYVTYVCSRCDDTYTEDIDPRGHIYAIRITPATCTSSGFTTCTCTLCGDTFTKDPVPALSHVDADGDGYCDYGCGANMGAPQSNCVCGEFHGGPFASIIIFFHRIVYFFKNLFK